MDLYEIAHRFVYFSLFCSISHTRHYTDSVGYIALIDNINKFNSNYYIYSGKYNKNISGIVEVDLDTFELNIINYGISDYLKRDYIKGRV